ncbi:MAG: dTDP-4-amino-4,6-dideoxygalactose transaminase [Gaiellaceae bacterium]
MRKSDDHIPFNRSQVVGTEQAYIAEAIARGQLAAGGPFTERCARWLEAAAGSQKALIVHSATAALEMAALLLEIEPGDEVLMPSFTFVSSANAVVLRGGTPVFVDIRADTLNLDESLLEAAITPRTKAIMPVHYAGVPCEMDVICELAAQHGLMVVEDAAQALGSTYRGRPAGGFGQLAAVSFHETKNVTSAEGGALLVNDERLVQRAEVIRDKGTDRSRFFRGEVDRYSWVDLGSSYGLSELNAAFLWAQLEAAAELNQDRMRTWALYHDALEPFERAGLLRRPLSPEHVEHNGHIYYVLLDGAQQQQRALTALNDAGVNAVFHYVPLHSSEAGQRYGRAEGSLATTEDVARRLIRLPLWSGMHEGHVSQAVEALRVALGRPTAPATFHTS